MVKFSLARGESLILTLSLGWSAARLIFNLRKRDHKIPCLIQLHWLPVSRRITYKLCVLMHSIHTGRSPRYLSDIAQSAASRTTRSGLRSAESTDYITPRLNTKFGERSFSHAGPASWNSLPADLRAISDCSVLNQNLKPIFFNQPSTFSNLLSFFVLSVLFYAHYQLCSLVVCRFYAIVMHLCSYFT